MEHSSPITSTAASSAGSFRVTQIIATVIFLVSAWYTVRAAGEMSAMSGMDMAMPGGWTMSGMWMPMGSWWAECGMFTLMWTAMMVAMMLPSAMPMILVYRRVTSFHQMAGAAVNGWLLLAAYFAVWSGLGVITYAMGIGLADSAMKWDAVSRAAPVASGAVLVLCGVYQLTPWKLSCLKHCRDPIAMLAGHLHSGRLGAVKLGLHHGIFCAMCCWSLMVMQMVLGMMNLVVMVIIALVIALEKILAGGAWVARGVGITAVIAGIWMGVRGIKW